MTKKPRIKPVKPLSWYLSGRLREIAEIIESVDARCMACDGPIGKISHEVTDGELRRIYLLAKGEKK